MCDSCTTPKHRFAARTDKRSSAQSLAFPALLVYSAPVRPDTLGGKADEAGQFADFK
jgi:hypothetical protein